MLHRDIQARVTLAGRPLLKICASAKLGEYKSRISVNSLTLLSRKSFAVACKTCRNVYPDNEVPNKTSVHGLVTTSPGGRSVCVSCTVLGIYCEALL